MSERIIAKRPPTLQRIIGIILLVPPLLSVLFFLISVLGLSEEKSSIPQLGKLEREWTGTYGFGDTGGGGYTSSAPIYLGLMAIAGSILLSSAKRSRDE